MNTNQRRGLQLLVVGCLIGSVQVAGCIALLVQGPSVETRAQGPLVVEVARGAGHLPLGTFDGDLGELDGAREL